MTQDTLVPVTQAALKLGLSRWTLLDWLRNGNAPGYKTPGGHWRVDLNEIRRWLRRHHANRQGD